MASSRSQAVLERVTRIDQLLRSGRAETLSILSKTLGVTERTVCRDLDFMKKDLGLPVSHSLQKGYFYASPVPPLERWEVQLVAGMSADGPIEDRIDPIRRILEVLHEALYSRRKIELQTTEPDRDGASFPFLPYFISRIAGELFLFGYRPDTAALLNLRLRVISGVEPLEETFSMCPAGEAKIRENQGWIAPGDAYSVRLRFAPGASWARDLMFTESQVVVDEGGATLIQVRTSDLEGVHRIAAFLGECVSLEEALPQDSLP